ncbi:MAG: tryptophan synthase subunit alpha [Thiobacillus sp.]
MKSRIDATFAALQAQQKQALIPFITAGDPDRHTTVSLMHALVDAGANILELGVPFSDPMADGPVIQRASERALAKGMGLRDVLSAVAEFRSTNTITPVVLMGYLNPIAHMGEAQFIHAAVTAGVDGVLTVDYPPEEASAFSHALKVAGIDPVFLISPTTPDTRISMIAEQASGFVYYVSLKGVTGAGNIDLAEVTARVQTIRQRCGVPVGVGFGIRDAKTASAIAGFADAVVVGSRIVQEIESSDASTVVDKVRTLVAGLRAGMDNR